ncbi:MAG: HD family phosphohydrolase [Rubrobacteraceae bacterium]
MGEIARRDIYAPSTVTYVDPLVTEQARQQAADAAPEAYRQDAKVPNQVSKDVKSYFDTVGKIRSSSSSRDQKVAKIANSAPFYLPDSDARTLATLDKNEVDKAKSYVLENLNELYKSTDVADSDVGSTAGAATTTISEARSRLSEAAHRDASGEVGDMVATLSRGFLRPNYVINRQTTQQARDATSSQVKPVQGSVQQGERIVSRGQVIDRLDLARLRAIGQTGGPDPWTVFLGVGLVVAAEMGIAWYFLERFGSRIIRTKAVIRVLLAASLTVLFTAVARAFMLFSINPYLIPLAGLSILGTILLGPRLMFLMVVVSSVNVGIIAGNNFLLSAALLISSGFAIYTVVRVNSRTELLKAGIFIAAVTAIVTFAVTLIGGSGLATALGMGAFGLGNGLLSLMIAVVLQPLLENAFNLLTPIKLLELSNPGSPLLHKLLRGAPGTFSHSMQVGNLAENAADRIGADALLARVGAYYHDIGKLEHPGYFIENQISQMNPHTALSPTLSAKIIKRHVKEGVDIGRAWDLPEGILDIIAQHHGTTRIEYFYRKALENALEGETIRESDFRYPGSRPRSKEAGIVMLADSVEATVKSLNKPTPKRIEDIVAATIKGKLEDGQFDECALTMREIHESGEAIREALIGFLGPRIEYPEPVAQKPPEKPVRNAT